jgi:hypothetical protein
MGLSPEFHDFSLLGLPIVSSALLSVVFAWISVLSFSSLVPLLGVFHLFIYHGCIANMCGNPTLLRLCLPKKTNTQVVSFSN